MAIQGRGSTRHGVTPREPPAERLHTDPEAQVYWLRTLKAQLAGKYGALYRQLHLTREQIAGFEQIYTDREEKDMDLSALSSTQLKETGTITQEFGMAVSAIEPEYQRRMRELLGDAGYQQLQEYEVTVPARTVVNDWAGMAVVVGEEPLTRNRGSNWSRRSRPPPVSASRAADWPLIGTA